MRNSFKQTAVAAAAALGMATAVAATPTPAEAQWHGGGGGFHGGGFHGGGVSAAFAAAGLAAFAAAAFAAGVGEAVGVAAGAAPAGAGGAPPGVLVGGRLGRRLGLERRVLELRLGLGRLGLGLRSGLGDRGGDSAARGGDRGQRRAAGLWRGPRLLGQAAGLGRERTLSWPSPREHVLLNVDCRAPADRRAPGKGGEKPKAPTVIPGVCSPYTVNTCSGTLWFKNKSRSGARLTRRRQTAAGIQGYSIGSGSVVCPRRRRS